MNRHLRAIAVAFFCPLVAMTWGCGEGESPGQPPGGGGSAPAPQILRLAWSQAAPSSAAVQGYSFFLFIDGARTSFVGSACAGAPAPGGFECSGPLPALAPGRRVLEVSALDMITSLEGPRSAPLTLDIGSDGRPRPLLSADSAPEPSASVAAPSTVCATETPTECFTVTVIARDLAPVRRLLPLPDGRLLVLLVSGAVTILPSGTSERPEFGSSGAGLIVDVVDVAADPDFGVNRFLYFATTATATDGRRTVSVVRVRELADRVGEPATVVADLPAAPGDNPAMSIGPDRRIYLAMPGPADAAAGYAGYILRFTPEGKGAGNDRNASPILAEGRSRPTRLAWDSFSRLLIGSTDSGATPGLAVVPIEVGSARWPASPTSVSGIVAAGLNAGLDDLAAARAPGGTGDVAMVTQDGTGRHVLRFATISLSHPPEIASPRTIPLGSLAPTAIAFAGDEDLFLAASRGTDPGVILIRLRRISP